MRRRSVVAMALRAVVLSALAVAPTTAGAEGFRVPTPVVRVLPNGLTVAIFPDDRAPMVEVQVLVEAGSVHEPPGVAGLANLTLQLLSQGTTSRQPATFAQDVADLGGAIGGSTGREFSTLSGSFLAADFEKGLELLADALINPLVDDGALPREKERLSAALMRARQNPATLADDHLWAMIHAGHPYERPAQGAVRALSALHAGQVRAFHRERYRPNRALLAIVGDVTPERGFRAAEEWFGPWVGRAAEFQPMAPAPPSGGWRVRIVDAPRLTAAEVRLGSAGPARAAKDYEALALGAEFLRSDLGGPARAGVVGLRDGGLFWLAQRTPVDSVGAEVVRLREALRRWTGQTVAEAALAPVRHRVVGGFPLQFETLAGVIGKWTAAAFNGLTMESVAGEPARIGALTADDVHAAAERWVTPERMMLVVIGPAERLRLQLEGIGPVEVVSGDVATDVVATPSTVTAAPAPEQAERGRALVKRALAAHGGIERLRAIRDSRIEGDIRLMGGLGEVSGQAVQLRKEPERFLFSTTFPGIKTVQVFDGKQGWSASGEPPLYEDLDSLTAGGLRAGFRSDLHHLLMTAADSTTRVAWRGLERLDTYDADVVEVVARDGERRVLFLDAANHRLLGMEQNEGGRSARRRYADFRDVNGILWPFSEERLLDGQRAMTLNLKRVAFNTGVKNETFQKPSSTPQRPR